MNEKKKKLYSLLNIKFILFYLDLTICFCFLYSFLYPFTRDNFVFQIRTIKLKIIVIPKNAR